MEVVKEWKEYLAGLAYNQALVLGDKSYYEMIDSNLAFASGDQWRNVQADGISKPIIPVIQKARQHTIANLTSTDISANINPLEYTVDEEQQTPEMQQAIETTKMANAEIRNLFDEFKYEFKVRELLGDGFDMGDYCLHFYWDAKVKPLKGQQYEMFRGKINCELVDAPNVMFGNPNNADPQKQPYILVVGRDLASTLEKEAKEYKNKTEVEVDNEWNYQAGDNGKVELEADKYGKALYVIKYYKDGDKVKATKFVQNAYIYKDIDLGLTVYPVAWGNYKKQKNTYHGRAEVTGMIPNQIAVNKLLAMVIYSAMNNAFPTRFYNADRMAALTNEIGKDIAVRNLQPGERVNDLFAYGEISQPASIVVSIIQLIIDYTKDMMGINDAAVGNVTPDNTSAIALAEKLTSVPLENIRSGLYEFTEQVVDICLDMMGTKYGVRPVKVKEGDNTSIQMFDFNVIKDLNVNKTIDVGAIGYASELSSLKELRDLLNLGAITVVDYLKRLPDNTVPDKDTLIREISFRMGLQTEEEAKQKNAQYEQMMAFVQQLPEDVQAQLKTLPDNEQEAAIMEMMKQAPQQQETQANANLNQAIGGIVEQ